MITGAQLRAARSLLGFSSAEVAGKAGLARNTIERLESYDGIPPSRSRDSCGPSARIRSSRRRVHRNARGRPGRAPLAEGQQIAASGRSKDICAVFTGSMSRPTWSAPLPMLSWRRLPNWQNRPLETLYALVFFDAIRIKVATKERSATKPSTLALARHSLRHFS